MSKGTVKLEKAQSPRNSELENSIIRLLTEILPQANVDVSDDAWKEAIGKLQEKIGNVPEKFKKIDAEISALKVRKPLDLTVALASGEHHDLGLSHKFLPDLLKILSAKLNVYLVGPSGAGKTHAARKCAEALGVPFYFTGAIANEYKLIGFMDANGKYVPTEFRKAYENGGVFLFDEIDASFPQAVLAFNAALANDFMDFPDKQVPKHKEFYCIAAANTIGLGADRQYVGRNQLDAASLDRFVFLEWPYDENLESALGGNEKWSNYVQQVRKVVSDLKIRHIISPRASISGAQLLKQGLERSKVEEMVLWKGLDRATVGKIRYAVFTTEVKADKDDCRFELEDEKRNKVPFKSGDKVEEGSIIGYVGSYYSRQYEAVKAPKSGTIYYKVEPGDAISKGTIIATIVSDYE